MCWARAFTMQYRKMGKWGCEAKRKKLKSRLDFRFSFALATGNSSKNLMRILFGKKPHTKFRQKAFFHRCQLYLFFLTNILFTFSTNVVYFFKNTFFTRVCWTPAEIFSTKCRPNELETKIVKIYRVVSGFSFSSPTLIYIQFSLCFRKIFQIIIQAETTSRVRYEKKSVNNIFATSQSHCIRLLVVCCSMKI